MSKRHRTLVALITCAALAWSGLALAGPAAAAVPKCNAGRSITVNAGWFAVPTYTGGGDYCTTWQNSTLQAATVDIQWSLKYCYKQNIKADGYFGPATVEALKAAQSWEGLTRDGIYGPATRKALLWPRMNHNTTQWSGSCSRLSAGVTW